MSLTIECLSLVMRFPIDSPQCHSTKWKLAVTHVKFCLSFYLYFSSVFLMVSAENSNFQNFTLFPYSAIYSELFSVTYASFGSGGSHIENMLIMYLTACT